MSDLFDHQPQRLSDDPSALLGLRKNRELWGEKLFELYTRGLKQPISNDLLGSVRGFHGTSIEATYLARDTGKLIGGYKYRDRIYFADVDEFGVESAYNLASDFAKMSAMAQFIIKKLNLPSNDMNVLTNVREVVEDIYFSDQDALNSTVTSRSIDTIKFFSEKDIGVVYSVLFNSRYEDGVVFSLSRSEANKRIIHPGDDDDEFYLDISEGFDVPLIGSALVALYPRGEEAASALESIA